MKIKSSTKITFPGGEISGASKVLFCKKMASDTNKMLIVTESTPFHPLDFNWPDQPSDKGMMKIDQKIFPVEKCLTAAIQQQTEEFLLDQEIKNAKIRRDDPHWYFLVVHVIDANLLNGYEENLIDKEVTLEVDTNYRSALSKSHTACHLAALALNKVTADFWKKALDRSDSFGNPNLDGEAIVESRIDEKGSVDRYRCGKSLRKKGFDDARFFSDDEFKRAEAAINKQLLDWNHSNGLAISVAPKTAYLHEKREWCCILSDGKEAKIPCGGTHPAMIMPQDKIFVTLKREGDSEFLMISQFVV